MCKESGRIFRVQNTKIFTTLPLHKVRKISHLNFEIKTDFLDEKNVAFDSFKVAGFSLKNKAIGLNFKCNPKPLYIESLISHLRRT